MPHDASNFNASVSHASGPSESSGVSDGTTHKPKRTPREEVYDIIRDIAATAGTGVTVDEVLGKSRQWHIVAVRHTATVAVAQRFPWMSYPQLARILGNRDHSSIMHVLRKMGAHKPRIQGGGGGANSVKARSYGHLMDILFVRIGAALSVPQTTTEGEATNV